MDTTEIYLSKTSKETQNIGRNLAKIILSNPFFPKKVCLYGELGAGKTVFAAGILSELLPNRRIVSPTFLIIKKYALSPVNLPIYHMDLYRSNRQQLSGSELEEIFCDSSSIVLVEWADRLEDLIPHPRLDIRISIQSDNERKICIEHIR